MVKQRAVRVLLVKLSAFLILFLFENFEKRTKNEAIPYFRTIQSIMNHEADRIEFTDIMIEKTNKYQDHTLINKIIFSDEAIFSLIGIGNKHSTIFWSNSNPNHVYDSKRLGAKKVMVWCGYTVDRRFGPYFFDGKVKSETYVAMLKEVLFNDRDNVNLFKKGSLILMQDGAPPHTAINTRTFLDTNSRFWLGKKSDFIQWPPYSLDLNPLDFFLWGYLKGKVYKDRYIFQDLSELKCKITEEFNSIPQKMMADSIQSSFMRRIFYVKQLGGKQVDFAVENKKKMEFLNWLSPNDELLRAVASLDLDSIDNLRDVDYSDRQEPHEADGESELPADDDDAPEDIFEQCESTRLRNRRSSDECTTRDAALKNLTDFCERTKKEDDELDDGESSEGMGRRNRKCPRRQKCPPSVQCPQCQKCNQCPRSATIGKSRPRFRFPVRKG